MNAWWRAVWEDIKAYRRGQRRVVPRRGVNGVITRGRIYAHKDEVKEHKARAKAKVVADIVITRANGQTEHQRVENDNG